MTKTIVLVWMVVIAPSGSVTIQQMPSQVCEQTQEAIQSVSPRPKILCIGP